SAAACVLVARAFSRVYGLGLTVEEEMDVAYLGERRTGSECGRMDQACAFGRVAVDLAFEGEAVHVEPLRAGAPLRLVIVDLKRAKDTGRILRDLNRCFTTREDAVARGVREALGPRNAEIAREARRLIETGDARGLGELMTEAQRLFDRLVAPGCPEELAAPRLHEVLAFEPIRDLVWGGKGVGSQGDGCAQFVARGPESQQELLRRLPEALGVECFPLTLGPG
ncbi:MAG: GHMP kinase, partial [Candidatus Methylomirabilis sp.]|nr:GHMP kinase [Deltaproteobacteria bacterium]